MADEQPANVVAFANAPGMITVTWDHSGEDVYWFVVEQESPYTFWPADRDKRGWSVLGLEPNHTYRYRVCALYDDHRECSDGWASVTTFPPEQNPDPPPPAPSPDDSGPQLPRYVSAIESVNFPGRVMRHRNFLGELTPVANAQDRADATFIVRSGLTGIPDTLSFESLNFPGHFLRHQGYRLKLHRNDGADLFRQDATFKLVGNRGIFSKVRYESVNYPGHFIRHSNFELWLAQDDGSELFALDSTWRRLPAPLGSEQPGTISFQSFNYPGYFIRHRNSLGEISRVASGLDRTDSTFSVRAGLNGSDIAVSLESVNHPGHFLRHQGFRLKLHVNDGSELFRNDASFFYNDGGAPEGNAGVSFESVNLPAHFIRHTNFQLWLALNDGTPLFGQDASWQPVPARTSI